MNLPDILRPLFQNYRIESIAGKEDMGRAAHSAEVPGTLRKLPVEMIEEALLGPDRVVNSGLPGRLVAERVFVDAGKEYLLRVLFERHGETVVIVTAYKTSKVGKYWRDRM